MSTRLALGTVQFGMAYGIGNRTGQVGRQAVGRMLLQAKTAGIDMLDTAISYGESEMRLGEAGVSTFDVVTKLPPLPQSTAEVRGWVRAQLLQSLARLRVQRVYGLLLHRPDQLHSPQGSALLDGLLEAQADGLTAKIGVSIYAAAELDSLMKMHPFGLVQSPLNLVDRRLVQSGWLDRLAAAGVEVHTRSAFLQGLLLLQQAEQQRLFPAWAGLWERWHGWLREVGGDSVTQCLAWALAQPGVTRVVVGADTREQLQAIVVAAAAAPDAAGWPTVACDDEQLINPSRWSRA